MAKDATKAKTKKTPAKKGSGPKAAPSGGVLRVQLRRSLIGASPYQRAVVAGLGLRRLNQIVERKDTPEIRGMVAKVSHLVGIVEGA